MKIPKLTFLLILVFSCSDKENRRPDDGRVENHVYTNEFFEIRIPVNSEWTIQTREEAKEIQEKGRERLREANDEVADQVEANDDGIQQLLTVFKNPVGASEGFNPSLIVMSEKLPAEAAEFDERAYLQLTREQLASTGLYSIIDDKTTKERVGGRDFSILKVTSNQNDFEITQEFYTNLQEGFALIIIISYSDKDQRNELKKMLSGVTTL